ncbi:MAG: hypothetical protein QM702_20720 [Rubrivivax sp.]
MPGLPRARRAELAGSALFRGCERSARTSAQLYAPAVRARKGTYLDLFTQASRAGISAARVDGAIVAIDPPPKLAKAKEHTIDPIVHYGSLAELIARRSTARLPGRRRRPRGPRSADATSTTPRQFLSTSRACSECGAGIPELDPRWFSFNTKQGQCEECEGAGVIGDDDGDGRPRPKRRACGGDRLAPIALRHARRRIRTRASWIGASPRPSRT